MKNKADKNTLKITDFDGIDLRDTHTDPLGTSELVNFRISSDGSLVRRNGYKVMATAPADIRAVWTGKLWGAFKCIVLAANTLYDFNYTTNTLDVLFNVMTLTGHAEFFYYRGELYLLDNLGFYHIKMYGQSYPHGYVPLVGKDWADNEKGEIYQPRNILNNKARFTYIISESAIPILCLDDYAASVDAMYINGLVVTSDRYSVGNSFPYVTVSGLLPGDRVELYITYRGNPLGGDALRSCTRACVFGGINNSRPFLFGGSDPSLIFSSRYVSEADVTAAKKVYSQADAMYFPMGYEFRVGDGQYAVKTVSRHYDRLLIFTEGGVWQADSSACGIEDFPVMNINMTVGVKSQYGAALLGNSPCAIGTDGIYRFTAETDELNDCNAYSISDKIAPLLDEEFFENAWVFADTWRDELLFWIPKSRGSMYVYSEKTGKWTTFEGIRAYGFFNDKTDIGFFCDNRLYVFDRSCDTDLDQPISASFEGNIAEFDTVKTKRLSSAEINYDGGSLDIYLTLEGDPQSNEHIYLSENEGHHRIEKRISSRRFKYLTPIISTDGSCKQIHSLTINVR